MLQPCSAWPGADEDEVPLGELNQLSNSVPKAFVLPVDLPDCDRLFG